MTGRLELRPDAYRVAVAEGAYILTHEGPVRLSGSSIAQWLDRLAPHLDGRHTLAELVAHLPPERRQLVERLVTGLQFRGVVRERDPQPAAGEQLPAAVAVRYAPEIAFVDYFRDHAAAAFARHRSATAMVVGSGPLLPAVVRAARRSGLAEVRTVDAATAADRALVAGADVVFQVGAADDPVRAVERACAGAGVPLGQALLTGAGQAWLLPVTDPAAPRWSAARLRLPAAPAPTSAGPDLTRAGAAAIAAALVHGAFRRHTGVSSSPDPDRLRRFDLDSLEATEHRFLAHPGAEPAVPCTEAEFRQRSTDLAGAARLTQEEFSRRAVRCVDARFGIVVLREHEWAQTPLHVSEATVRPARWDDDPDPDPPVRTTRVGYSYQAARVAATLRALAHYGELTVDPRRLLGPDRRPLAAPDGSDLSQLRAGLRSGAVAGGSWGYEVPDPDRVRLVPAASAFPRWSGGYRRAAPPGLAAGLDWQEAVRTGLLGCVRAVTLAEAGSGGAPYPAVDLTAAALDPTGARCRELLAALGERPEAYDLTGRLGVPVYAFCRGTETVAVTTGSTAAAALAAGLHQLLRAVQAEIHRQPELAPRGGPALPVARRGRDPVLPADGPTGEWDVPALAATLRRAGRVPVAVPLDHDPHLVGVLPYLVHVVLCHD